MRKIRIIAVWKQKPPAVARFVFRSEEIPTFSGPTSRFDVGLLAETEPFTTTDLLFLKPSHETELYTDRIDIAPSAAALATIDQALDTIEANAGFLRSLPSGKRMTLRGLSYCNEGFAIDSL